MATTQIILALWLRKKNLSLMPMLTRKGTDWLNCMRLFSRARGHQELHHTHAAHAAHAAHATHAAHAAHIGGCGFFNGFFDHEGFRS
jgi:hypothetical protein